MWTIMSAAEATVKARTLPCGGDVLFFPFLLSFYPSYCPFLMLAVCFHPLPNQPQTKPTPHTHTIHPGTHSSCKKGTENRDPSGRLIKPSQRHRQQPS